MRWNFDLAEGFFSGALLTLLATKYFSDAAMPSSLLVACFIALIVNVYFKRRDVADRVSKANV